MVTKNKFNDLVTREEKFAIIQKWMTEDGILKGQVKSFLDSQNPFSISEHEYEEIDKELFKNCETVENEVEFASNGSETVKIDLEMKRIPKESEMSIFATFYPTGTYSLLCNFCDKVMLKCGERQEANGMFNKDWFVYFRCKCQGFIRLNGKILTDGMEKACVGNAIVSQQIERFKYFVAQIPDRLKSFSE